MRTSANASVTQTARFGTLSVTSIHRTDMPRKPRQPLTPLLSAYLQYANAGGKPEEQLLDAYQGLMNQALAESIRSKTAAGLNLEQLLSKSAHEIRAEAGRLRDTLLQVSSVSDKWLAARQAESPETQRRLHQEMADIPIPMPSAEGHRQLRCSPEGRLHFEATHRDLWDLLIDELLALEEPWRLRACKVCGTLFWARRLDARNCTPKHAAQWRRRTYLAAGDRY